MKLKKLLRAEELSSRKTKIIRLDYSHIEGMEMPKDSSSTADEEIKKQKQIEKAEQKAKSIVEKANEEAQNIKDINQKNYELEMTAIKQEYENKEIVLQQKFTQHKEVLEEEYKIKHEELQKERENISIQLEISKEDIRQKVVKEIIETVTNETKERVRGEYTQLMKQVHAILDQAIEKRRYLIKEFEHEVADLVLLIVQKIVKVISEEDRSVVIKNLHHSLSLLKDREHFLIHVNTIDLSAVRDEVDSMKKLLEIKGLITVVEDSTIEPGGCVIETELGEVDARISTQLLEMTNKVREISPIKHAKF